METQMEFMLNRLSQRMGLIQAVRVAWILCGRN